MAITVTATAVGGTSAGMVLRVYVLTGAANPVDQHGNTWVQSAAAAHNVSASTTVTGSRVYGAVLNGAAASPTVFDTNTTLVDAVADAGHTKDYGTWKSTNATGTPGAITLGFTDNNNGGIAGVEILPNGTITEDASAPAVTSTTGATTLTTASFTPVAGGLLVALVAANAASSVVLGMSVTDSSGMSWAQVAVANASNMKYAGVFIAGAQNPQALPHLGGQQWRRQNVHRQYLPPAVAPAAAAAAPFVPQLLQPPTAVSRHAPGRARLGKLGACAAGILAATTLSPVPSSVPPSRPQPVIAHPAPHRATAKGTLVPPQLPFTTAKLPPTAVSPRPPHRAVTRWYPAKTTLSPVPSSVPPSRPQPVINRHLPPHGGTWRAVAGPAPSAAQAAPAVARPQPVTNRPPAPHRATGKGILASNPNAPQPSRVPPPLWRQPFAPRPAHRAIWRGIAGPAPAVVIGGAASRPQPTVNRPPAPHRAIVRHVLAVTSLSPQPPFVPAPGWRPQPRFVPPHRAAWRIITGTPPAVAAARPARPRPVTNRPPPPHQAITRQLPAKTTLAAQPVLVPAPHWQPQPRYRPPHRAAWGHGPAGPPSPPPPFSVGALTASAAPGDTLTAADAAAGTLTATASAAALTASVAPSGTAAYAATYSAVYGPAEGVLTAADTRAGGPS